MTRPDWSHAALLGLILCGGCSPKPAPAPPSDAGPTTTFSEASTAALTAMEESYYHLGNWELCAPTPCLVSDDDFDWGADSLTDALYLRWLASGDAEIVTMMESLNANGPTYGTCTAGNCPSWSDVPMWDSIAASREFQVTGDAPALVRAKEAFTYVDTATQFLLGACPTIDFQQPDGGANQLKTLETDSNYIKAALLLNQLDPDGGAYLAKAVSKYAAVRQNFLDREVALYTAYIIDDGQSCTTVPHQFYASVNGNLIWSGVTLASVTGDSTYLSDAIATGQAVAQNLSDAAGVYADLQADCDVAEPMIEGMNALDASGQSFAHDWLLTNARAMSSAMSPFGIYGRFFDGPPPPATITEWQANGGLALIFVAAALEPDGGASNGPSDWANAIPVSDDLSTFPSMIQFTGRAIALYGTLGEDCCEPGHAQVLIDGAETFDQTGIWQNEVNVFQPVPDSILFAWRWPTSGMHTLTFQPGITDPKQGGGFLHLQSYSYVP